MNAWGQLKVIAGPHQHMLVWLTKEQITIGRCEGDIVLPEDTAVSQRHARIERNSSDELLLIDDSKYGSQVNNVQIHHGTVPFTLPCVISVR